MIISLYSKPLCPYCDGAEHYLQKNGFKYNKIDITEDADAMEFVKSKGHRTVPQLYLEGRILVEGGYDGLRQLLPFELTHRMQQYVNGDKI
jgi:glutaredoxin-like protein NrdH